MSMTIPSLLSLILALAPYEQSQRDLESASESIHEATPAEAIAQIEAALAEALRHPRELADDPSASEKLARARLALAWAQLAVGDREAASATMDLALSSATGRELSLIGLGPDIRKLHDERRAALEAKGRATITVDCDGCEVLIDEVEADNPSSPLWLGTHRVWLFDPSGTLEPRQELVDLGPEGVTLEYRPELTPEPQPEIEPVTQPVAKPIRRKAPIWAKVLGMGLGVGATVAGGVLLAIDGKCRGGGTPTPDNVDTCSKVWNHPIPSYALLGIGGGLLVGATVWLTVDEVRAGGPRRASAMIGWTMRF